VTDCDVANWSMTVCMQRSTVAPNTGAVLDRIFIFVVSNPYILLRWPLLLISL